MDYRISTPKSGMKFDQCVVSVGMVEACGKGKLRQVHGLCGQGAESGGVFLLHFISSQKQLMQGDPWIKKYIFPAGSSQPFL